MTKSSYACKQFVIYGRRVNSRRQKPTQSSERQLGPLFFFSFLFFWRELACVFFPFMPKHFARQLAPSSFSLQSQRVRKDIHHPPGFKLCGSVSGSPFCVVLAGRDQLTLLNYFTKWAGVRRYSIGFKVWPICHLSICHDCAFLFFFPLQVWRQKGNVISHGSFVIW